MSINSDSYSQKTIYLRYRVYDSGDAWTTANGVHRNEVEFKLKGLSSDAYYEIEASMGEDFMSCHGNKGNRDHWITNGQGPACHNDPHGTIHHCNNTYHYHYHDNHHHHDHYN